MSKRRNLEAKDQPGGKAAQRLREFEAARGYTELPETTELPILDSSITVDLADQPAEEVVIFPIKNVKSIDKTVAKKKSAKRKTGTAKRHSGKRTKSTRSPKE